MSETPTENPILDLREGRADNDPVRALWQAIMDNEPVLTEAYKAALDVQPPDDNTVKEKLAKSDDPDIAAIRDELTALETQLAEKREAANKLVLSTFQTVSDEERIKAEQAYRKVRQEVGTSLGMLWSMSQQLSTLPGYKEVGETVAAYRTRVLPPNLGSGGASRSASGGDGTPRARISSVEVEKNGKVKSYPSIGQACTYISGSGDGEKVKSDDLIAKWLEAAKASRWQDVKEPTTFEINECKVTITP